MNHVIGLSVLVSLVILVGGLALARRYRHKAEKGEAAAPEGVEVAVPENVELFRRIILTSTFEGVDLTSIMDNKEVAPDEVRALVLTGGVMSGPEFSDREGSPRVKRLRRLMVEVLSVDWSQIIPWVPGAESAIGDCVLFVRLDPKSEGLLFNLLTVTHVAKSTD